MAGADVFRGLAQIAAGLLMNPDPAATPATDAAGDGLTRGLPRDADGALLVAFTTAKEDAKVASVAAASDATRIVCRAPFDGVVSGVSYVPEAGITGNTTETRTFGLVNKGQSGGGSTSVASLAMVTGTNATAFDEKAITLSGTAANLDVAEGDVLVFTSTHGGSTGLADPGGLVTVRFERDVSEA